MGPSTSADEGEDAPESTAGPGGNKMDLDNLALVMAPNIIYSKSKNPIEDDSLTCILVIQSLLKLQNDLWHVPDNMANLLLEDMRGYDAEYPDPSKEKEIMKRFEDVIVKMKKSVRRNSMEITLLGYITRYYSCN